LQLVAQLRFMIDTYKFSTKILAASIRNSDHFEGAIIAGADCITVPVNVLEQLTSHSLTDKGMVQFLDDWNLLSVKKFPS